MHTFAKHGEKSLPYAILRGAHIFAGRNGDRPPAELSRRYSHCVVQQAASLRATIGPTIFGSALPFESFITWPTKNPAAAFLPAL